MIFGLFVKMGDFGNALFIFYFFMDLVGLVLHVVFVEFLGKWE